MPTLRDEDTELRHGYMLRDMERLARAAVRRDVWHQSLPLSDRLDTAWFAIVEHLYSCDERPAEASLIRAAWSALRDETDDDWHTHGVSRTNTVYEGDHVMPNFVRYWASGRYTPSPEEQIVELVAFHQIWAALPQQHQIALSALAEHNDYGKAAESLGKRRGALTEQISRARQNFLVLWHEGEKPSRPWGYDRRRNTNRNNIMDFLARRRKQRQRRGTT
jgi:hypothetical protein